MRLFLDTNILLYTQDITEAPKRERARALLGEHAGDDIVVSTQVLLEFYRNLQRNKLCTPADAALLCGAWMEHEVVPVTPALVASAIGLHQEKQLSIWDALVLQAALESRCSVIYTEDLQHGMRVGPLQIVNPFLAHEVHEPAAAYRVRRATAATSLSAGKAAVPSTPAGKASSPPRRRRSPR
jgi:predicted nucleic acid-binding protein